MKIPYNKQYIFNDSFKIVSQSLRSEFITTGTYVKKFEQKLKILNKVKYSIVTNSGTSALHLAFESIKVKKGDNVIIPAINFIDINYGENASMFGGHWHTHNDTADKVSAESLGYIGNILELGLITSAWTLSPTNSDENSNTGNQDENVMQQFDNEEEDVEKSRFVGYISIILVSIILVLILMADISLKL